MKITDVRKLAAEAHAGQLDKIGIPYIEHVQAVAAGLSPLGAEMEMAGLLHDIIEDTKWTAAALLEKGIPSDVVTIVEAVTNTPGEPYQEKIRRICSHPEAVLVKIADNAHNSRPDRTEHLPEGTFVRLAHKYRLARLALWPAVPVKDVKTVVSIVNPSLLVHLPSEPS